MILDDVQRHALAKPDEVALAFYASSSGTPQILTWRALWDRLSCLAAALSEGFGAGDRVLLAFPQGIEFHLCQLACHYAGLIPIPVPLPSSESGQERLRGIS
ncbi:MAG: AMP-binding protein, partial [Pseudomonadota bacterium]